MTIKYIARYKNLLAAGIFIPFFFCASATEKRPSTLDNAKSTHFMEYRENDSITLFWNAPPWDPDTLQYYELHYHTSQDTVWKLCKGNIPPTPNPQVVLHRDALTSSDSIFFFRIQYVSMDGIISEPHYSYDSTALQSGWYMLWKPK